MAAACTITLWGKLSFLLNHLMTLAVLADDDVDALLESLLHLTADRVDALLNGRCGNAANACCLAVVAWAYDVV